MAEVRGRQTQQTFLRDGLVSKKSNEVPRYGYSLHDRSIRIHWQKWIKREVGCRLRFPQLLLAVLGESIASTVVPAMTNTTHTHTHGIIEIPVCTLGLEVFWNLGRCEYGIRVRKSPCLTLGVLDRHRVSGLSAGFSQDPQCFNYALLFYNGSFPQISQSVGTFHPYPQVGRVIG